MLFFVVDLGPPKLAAVEAVRLVDRRMRRRV
jgi:hypothetical protein